MGGFELLVIWFVVMIVAGKIQEGIDERHDRVLTAIEDANWKDEDYSPDDRWV